MTIRRRFLVATVVTWCIGTLLIEALRIRSVFAGPRDAEEYVYHLDFQLFASAFLVVTRWVPLLGVVLLLELGIFALLSAIEDRRHAESTR